MNPRNRLLLQCLFGVLHLLTGINSQLLYEWKYIDYVWDNPSQKQEAIDNGNYVADNCIPHDVDHSQDGRTFVSLIGDKGVPATLTTVSNQMGDCGPLLKPYPSWSWFMRKDNTCSGMMSVYRVAIKCNHIFALDSGQEGDDQVCPPQLLIFDLATDKLVKRVIIPREYATNANGTGRLVNLVIETQYEECSPEFNFNVYMADIKGYGLVIWNERNFTRIESPYFNPDPKAETFNIDDKIFHLAFGLMGMSLAMDSPNQHNHLLYFRPVASYDMYYTTTEQLLSRGDDQSSIKYFTEPTKLASQSGAQAFSKKGILFFTEMTERSLLCWNRHKPFTPENIVTIWQNDEMLQFVTAIKMFFDSVYMISNRYQDVVTNTMNYTQFNFRVMLLNFESLVNGTNCE